MRNKIDEAKTVAPRNITLSLSDADCLRIAEFAGMHNTTVSNILEEFIGNLIDGTYSSGSDERMLASQYFERTGTSWMFDKSFLTWTFNNWVDTDSFADMVSDIAYDYDIINDPESGAEDVAGCKEDLSFILQTFREDYYDPYKEDEKEPVSFDIAVEQALTWYKQYKDLLGE